jgi:predicted RNase H-like HicB family nuclease
MKLNAIVYEAEEGGHCAKAPAIPGRATQGDSFKELFTDFDETVEGYLSVDVSS